MYSPAQTAAEQVNVPIFKMRGSAPIYQYDFGLNVTTGNAAIVIFTGTKQGDVTFNLTESGIKYNDGKGFQISTIGVQICPW